MEYQLGIIGGVGSEASAYFYEKLIRRTKADRDQEHLNILLLNHAAIPDRTAYILDHSKPNPLPAFLSDLALLNQAQVKMVVIPCNTSFYFYEEFQKHSQAPVYHLIDNTIASIAQRGIKKVGILATDGTIASRLYQTACEKAGIEWVIPDADHQKLVMSLIYDNIKKGKEIDKDIFQRITEQLRNQHAECILLACTELSLLKEKEQLSDFYVDPLDVAADAVLTFFHKEQR